MTDDASSQFPEVPEGYQQVPEEDRKKARVFFDKGRAVAGTGNYEFSIEMFISGLEKDPDAVAAHQELRDISLKRKASGGKSMGFFEAAKLKRPSKDDKQNMINAERLLAHDPGNTDYMIMVLQNSLRAGFYDTTMWMGPILQKANADSPKPEFNKFIILKDAYRALGQWKLASDAANYALRLRPDDMDLQTEVKNLGAQHTMTEGGYGRAGSFRDSVKDLNQQQRLLDGDKGVTTGEIMSRIIGDAEAEYATDTADYVKLGKLVDALEKSEDAAHENRAVELLQRAFDESRQFRFRQRIGRIHMKQMQRTERNKRQALAADPNNEELRRDYAQFRTEQIEAEYNTYRDWVENYPTDLGFKFEMARRLFQLRRFNDAIPLFQQVRSDPRHKAEASVYLGCSFLESNYLDEADETLDAIIQEYQFKGNGLSKEMHYWRGRALEQKAQIADALKLYSQVAQWDFNYRDVQGRIKRLRPGAPPSEETPS